MNKKILIIAAAAVIVLGAGAGGTFMLLSPHHAGPPKPAPPPPPKPIYFAELADLVVSVPSDSTDSTPSYIQITLQFASFDPNAVTTFTNLLPIIRAQIITLLMGGTAKSLMNTSTHDALCKSSLAIANQVLDKSANYTPPNPFNAVYITNLVEQN